MPLLVKDQITTESSAILAAPADTLKTRLPSSFLSAQWAHVRLKVNTAPPITSPGQLKIMANGTWHLTLLPPPSAAGEVDVIIPLPKGATELAYSPSSNKRPESITSLDITPLSGSIVLLKLLAKALNTHRMKGGNWLSLAKEIRKKALRLGIHRIIPYLLSTYGGTNNDAPQASDEKNAFRNDLLASIRHKPHTFEFSPLDDIHLNADKLAIKLIAFYLPQFHPIPENDKWWGRGFTEWTNVSKATPQFIGHYQPRLPGELGFYDLRLKDIQKRQIELARQHGIYGFCYHHYWFGGKRLLELPFQQALNDPSLDMPFCLCWANENWSRRWDGSESDILMAQAHSPEDDLAFIKDIEPALKDNRYIRVDGKPLLIVYRPSLLPDAKATAARWRNYCIQNGIGDLHLVAALSFDIGPPEQYGFDAAAEFPPHQVKADKVTKSQTLYDPQYSGTIYDYRSLVKSQAKPRNDNFLCYRTAFPSWDNEARKPGRATTFANNSPALYEEWLSAICEQALRNEDSKRLIFINAWNEWGEGAHLEPDRRYGYSFLQATRWALGKHIKEEH